MILASNPEYQNHIMKFLAQCFNRLPFEQRWNYDNVIGFIRSHFAAAYKTKLTIKYTKRPPSNTLPQFVYYDNDGRSATTPDFQFSRIMKIQIDNPIFYNNFLRPSLDKHTDRFVGHQRNVNQLSDPESHRIYCLLCLNAPQLWNVGFPQINYRITPARSQTKQGNNRGLQNCDSFVLQCTEKVNDEPCKFQIRLRLNYDHIKEPSPQFPWGVYRVESYNLLHDHDDLIVSEDVYRELFNEGASSSPAQSASFSMPSFGAMGKLTFSDLQNYKDAIYRMSMTMSNGQIANVLCNSLDGAPAIIDIQRKKLVALIRKTTDNFRPESCTADATALLFRMHSKSNQLVCRMMSQNKIIFSSASNSNTQQITSSDNTQSSLGNTLDFIVKDNPTLTVWMYRSQIKLFHLYGHCLFMDSTHGTNTWGFKLTIIWCVTSFNRIMPVSFAILRNEDATSYIQMLNAIRDFVGDAHFRAVRTIFTDGDQAMARSIRELLPWTNHQLCWFHLRQNIKRHRHNTTVQNRILKVIDAASKRQKHEVVCKGESGFYTPDVQWDLWRSAWPPYTHQQRMKHKDDLCVVMNDVIKQIKEKNLLPLVPFDEHITFTSDDLKLSDELDGKLNDSFAKIVDGDADGSTPPRDEPPLDLPKLPRMQVDALESLLNLLAVKLNDNSVDVNVDDLSDEDNVGNNSTSIDDNQLDNSHIVIPISNAGNHPEPVISSQMNDQPPLAKPRKGKNKQNIQSAPSDSDEVDPTNPKRFIPHVHDELFIARLRILRDRSSFHEFLNDLFVVLGDLLLLGCKEQFDYIVKQWIKDHVHAWPKCFTGNHTNLNKKGTSIAESGNAAFRLVIQIKGTASFIKLYSSLEFFYTQMLREHYELFDHKLKSVRKALKHVKPSQSPSLDIQQSVELYLCKDLVTKYMDEHRASTCVSAHTVQHEGEYDHLCLPVKQSNRKQSYLILTFQQLSDQATLHDMDDGHGLRPINSFLNVYYDSVLLMNMREQSLVDLRSQLINRDKIVVLHELLSNLHSRLQYAQNQYYAECHPSSSSQTCQTNAKFELDLYRVMVKFDSNRVYTVWFNHHLMYCTCTKPTTMMLPCRHLHFAVKHIFPDQNLFLSHHIHARWNFITQPPLATFIQARDQLHNAFVSFVTAHSLLHNALNGRYISTIDEDVSFLQPTQVLLNDDEDDGFHFTGSTDHRTMEEEQKQYVSTQVFASLQEQSKNVQLKQPNEDFHNIFHKIFSSVLTVDDQSLRYKLFNNITNFYQQSANNDNDSVEGYVDVDVSDVANIIGWFQKHGAQKNKSAASSSENPAITTKEEKKKRRSRKHSDEDEPQETTSKSKKPKSSANLNLSQPIPMSLTESAAIQPNENDQGTPKRRLGNGENGRHKAAHEIFASRKSKTKVKKNASASHED